MGRTVSGAERESWYGTRPDHKIDVTRLTNKITVVFQGKTIAESHRVIVLRETDHDPVYYFPRDAVQMGYLERNDHRTYCPFKGEASYWTLNVGGRRCENAVWSYEDPLVEVSGIKDYLAFFWDKADAWYADDEPIVSPKA